MGRDSLSSASLLQPLQSPRATLLWDLLMGESLGERRLHLTSFPGKYLCVILAPTSVAAASSTRTRSSLLLLPNALQWAKLPQHSREQCEEIFPGYISDGMICAGGKGHATCNGDSGGPLVCPDAN